VEWLREQLAGRCKLDHLAHVHHRHAVADALDHAEVMRDKQVRQPEPFLQLEQQIQDLRLDRHVERRYRFVRHDERRPHNQSARNSHSSTLLNTGEVLVVGNFAPSELYDPVSGTWSITGSVNNNRAFHAATLLPTGEVLIAGGNDLTFGGFLTSSELYDRTSGAWSIFGYMATGRNQFPAVLLLDSTVMAIGGDMSLGSTAACEIYDRHTGFWTPTGNMNQDRLLHTGTLLPSGKVLVTGGLSESAGNGQVVSTAELFDPGAPFTLFSCDGANVVTDPSGDAVNPAPGGAGPTDQADIVGISFSADASKTTLITTMTLHNLSQVPSPGTTSTTYNVVWTSSNTIQYATQVTAPDPSGSLSYFWGPWNAKTNQLSSFNPTTGTFNAGQNGTITVNIPLSGLGNPTIPITDFSQTAAVTNPFGLTFAGEGALGNGATFTNPMDVAPNSGGGARWAVCPLPVQLTGVVSRKVHGSAGTFNINLPLSGNPGVECRSGGANGNHTLVFTFANPLSGVSSASVSTGTGSVSSSNIDGNDPHKYIVNLSGITNAQTITVSLTNVADSLGNFSSAVSASMGVLFGDVNASRDVDSADVFLVRQQTLHTVTTSNFRDDINASGDIDSADVFLVRKQTLTSLP